jgi:hypothetical protein
LSVKLLAKSLTEFANRHPVVSVVATLVIVFSVIAFLGSLSDNSSSSAPRTGVTAATGEIPNNQNVNPNFPPLRYSSSRSLPAKLHWFQLGMSVSDALAHDSKIEYFDSSKGKPSPSDANAQLDDKLPEGFSVSMSFRHGRLVWIMSEVGDISPDDAQLFDRDTLSQLGPPSVNVYQGSDRTTWVWVDGDVRLQYTNRPEGLSNHGLGGPRIVSLEMCVYPEMHQKDPLIARGWGDATEPVVLKRLTDGIGGLRLRTAPWQVRQAVPGIDITAVSEQKAGGEFTNGDYRVTVEFWEGHLMSFCEYWSNQRSQHYLSVRDHSLQLWGTPARGFSTADLENIVWDDGHTMIDYDCVKGTGNAGALFSRCFIDLELAQLADTTERPAQFKPAPSTKSFF